ncbi:MAG: glycoside hydrolase family 55 protein [Thermoguttaceae bacterium]|nr:glycoside hydrolase family 55 protein [Thermoguttaceae bacterium]MDW8078768.1 glycosyl hydrolase family 28-related protein [Thermoguttaceae bacterium]
MTRPGIFRTCVLWLCFCVHLSAILFVHGNPARADEEAQFSRLWGKMGENWRPDSRLPDLSQAGYRRGMEPYRIPTARVSIRDFGARGDGQTDDSEAFRRALEAGAGKLIELPPGRYVLNGLFSIRRSGTVLRGAGPDRTIIVFQTPGDKLSPQPTLTDGNQPTTGWSWANGLISVGTGRYPRRSGVRVVEEQKRGDMKLIVEKNSFRPGDEILLRLQDDAEKSLLRYLYRGHPGNISGLNNWQVVQVFRVTESRDTEIKLDRALRFDVRLSWRPQVEPFVPTVTDVGVEGLCFEFPLEKYRGEFQEVGWNPIEIKADAAHCWLRDVLIRNADSGPYVHGFFCTVEKIVFEADPERLTSRGYCGHHGITVSGHDCLVRDFDFRCRFVHDLTVQSAIGCVFAEGKGIDVNFDHHRWAPYENLFTAIDAGRGSRLFASSGGGMRGNHSAAGATFWAIRTQEPVPWPKHFGVPCINLVGVNVSGVEKIAADLPEVTDCSRPWAELIPPHLLRPTNLYEAQKALKSKVSAQR